MNDGSPTASGVKPDEASAKQKAAPAAPASAPKGQEGAPKSAAPNPAGQPPAAAEPPKAPAQDQGQNQAPNQAKPQGQAQPQAQPQPKPAAPVDPPQRPVARRAHMRRRHWGLMLSFLLLVVLPIGATGFYLWGVAKPQYGSVAGFTVRQDEGGSASELLGGLAQLTGGPVSSSDGDILYEFILSQALVQALDDDVDLRGHYSQYWDEDPVFSLWPDASIEALEWYWQRIVQVSFDQGTGLIELRSLAFDPETAQQLTTKILERSQDMINALNAQAREDALRYATQDLEAAVEQLKQAREALTSFRTRTQIVDPAADIQGRLGVMNNLQQQLAEALIELDLLVSNTANSSDPRISQAQARVEVIQARIEDERNSFASGASENGSLDENYPTLIAEFEGLSVDREYAEESYRVALTALAATRAQSARQSRYLATYVQPTLAQTSEFPQRYSIFGLVTLFLLLSWSVMALIYYSIRDRS